MTLKLATRKAETAAELLQASDKYTLLQMLLASGNLNMVKIDKYTAENIGAAKARYELGESGRGQSNHVGHNSRLNKKIFSYSWSRIGHKLTLYLGFKDLSSKKGNAADWRMMTICDVMNPERNLEYIEVCDRFGKWIKVDLRDLPDFPILENDEDIHEFNEVHAECLSIGALIEVFNKRINALKTKAKKAKKFEIESVDGSKLVFEPPIGMSDRIVVVETGESIPTEKRSVWKVRLFSIVPEQDLDKLYPNWTEVSTKGKFAGVAVLKSDIDLLPIYMTEMNRLRAEYEGKYKEIRPYEMGIIEHAEDEEGGEMPDGVSVGDVEYEIELNETYEYDQPADTAEKLKSGIYEKRSVSIRSGKWTLIPVPIVVEV